MFYLLPVSDCSQSRDYLSSVTAHKHRARADIRGWSYLPVSKFLSLIPKHLEYDLKLHKFRNRLSKDVKDFFFRFISSTIYCIEVTQPMTIFTSEIFTFYTEHLNL